MKIHPDGDPQMFAPLYGLGRVLLGLGRLDEAEEQLARALRILGEGSDDPRAHIARGVLGEVRMRRGRYAEAEILLLASEEALARQFAPDHPENVRARARLVALYDGWGGLAEAPSRNGRP